MFIDYKNGVLPQVEIKYKRGDKVFIHRATHTWTKFSGKLNIIVVQLTFLMTGPRDRLVLQQVLPSHWDIREVHIQQHWDWAGGCLEEEDLERDEEGVLQQPGGQDSLARWGWGRSYSSTVLASQSLITDIFRETTETGRPAGRVLSPWDGNITHIYHSFLHDYQSKNIQKIKLQWIDYKDPHFITHTL